jgi:hypothetical protein
LPQDPPAPEILDPGAGGENEDQQWNPMEWDRAAEELTWERLLGKSDTITIIGIDRLLHYLPAPKICTFSSGRLPAIRYVFSLA